MIRYQEKYNNSIGQRDEKGTTSFEDENLPRGNEIENYNGDILPDFLIWTDIQIDPSQTGIEKLGEASSKILVKPVSGFVLRKRK